MSASALETLQAEPRIGHILDDTTGNAIQAAVLAIREGKLVLSLPYIQREKQFKQTESWFNKRALPKSLLFVDPNGFVTLTGLHWLGHGMGQFSTGRVMVDIGIFGRPRRLKEAYNVRHFESQIDGLRDFAGFRPIVYNEDNVDGRWRIQATIDAHEKHKWRHGGFTFEIRSSAPSLGSVDNFSASADAVIATSRSKGASIDAHLTAQWPIRALLLLAFGEKLAWRGHKLRDDAFPTWMMSGPPLQASTVDVLYRRTMRDTASSVSDRIWPIFSMQDLDTRKLMRWMRLYDDPIFRRAIEPTVEVLNGASNFLEPQLMMTVIGLDSMGHFRDPNRSGRVALETQIVRCMKPLRLDWSAFGHPRGIALAIARANNDLKHPDRNNRPSTEQLRLTADLAMIIMRLQAIDLLGLTTSVTNNFARGNDYYHLSEAFREAGVRINKHGEFVEYAR